MTSYARDANRKYDLYSETAKKNPYLTYAQMRDNDPVHVQPGMDGQTPVWWVTRYEDVEQALKDNQRFVRDWRLVFPPPPTQGENIWDLLDEHMLNKDGADHRRLRNLVSKAFTPKMIRALEPRIQAIANELIDGVIDAGEMDLVNDFAYHLPTIVIAELLGIPVIDRNNFKRWSSVVTTPIFDMEQQQEMEVHLRSFIDYIRALFAERRASPQDDLISGLLQVEEGGDRLSEAEIISMMFLLMIAGHETTVNLIGNSVKALWKNPEQLERLKTDPALMDTAVEELIRYDGPVERALVRFTIEDVELGGVTIPRGNHVILVLGSANHDPALFDEADQLDLSRQPNPHLGFGKGAHYCLGAPLARLETAVALRTLLTRLPNLQPAVPLEALIYRNVPIFRSLDRLPVKW